jgi:hypothetical protein
MVIDYMGIIQSKVTEKPKTVDESDVDRLERMLVQIDTDVVVYLKNPKNHPAPDFERLIAQIQALPERKDFPGTLTLKISNLKHKAYYYERSWRQIKENVNQTAKESESDSSGRGNESYSHEPGIEEKEAAGKNLKRVEKLFEVQQKKWDEHKAELSGKTPETRQAFEERILNQYHTLKDKSAVKDKLVLTWNKEKNQCDLIIDRRGAEAD